jgi:hypothetical protein
MAGAKEKKLTLAIDEDPKIITGTLEGLAEYRAGGGKRFKSLDEMKAYLERP